MKTPSQNAWGELKTRAETENQNQNPRDTYLPPEKRQQTIDEIRLM